MSRLHYGIIVAAMLLCYPAKGITGDTAAANVYQVAIDKEYLVIVEVKTIAKTGVEIDALCGASAALLTLWDVVKKYEKDENGQAGANHDAPVQMRCECQSTYKGNDGDRTIVPLGLPGMDKAFDIYQPHDCHHDNCRQYRLGQMVEKRCKNQ